MFACLCSKLLIKVTCESSVKYKVLGSKSHGGPAPAVSSPQFGRGLTQGERPTCTVCQPDLSSREAKGTV